MKSKNEECITRFLAEKEIININRSQKFVSNPTYNLGKFLDNYVPEPSPYEGKYVFIR